MELSFGQSEQRKEAVAEGFTSAKKATQDINSEWWMNHQRQMDDADTNLREKEKEGWRKTEDDIADPNARWAQACGRYSDMRDPFGSLATAARAEGSAFQKEQEDLRRAEARESDPQKREMLKLQRHVEAADYMAITSERLAGISRVISGRRGSESELYYNEEATKYREIATEERKLYRQLRENADEKIMGEVHDYLAGKRSQPAQRTGTDDREQSFSVPQDLPENAPNRDRPQNDQRSVEPARENLFDAAASRDQERHAAGEEITDAKKEQPAQEMSDADKEFLAELGMRANNQEKQIAQQQERSQESGRGR